MRRTHNSRIPIPPRAPSGESQFLEARIGAAYILTTHKKIPRSTIHVPPHRRRRARLHGQHHTQGPIKFHEWLGDSWGILFSHPKEFTPVCTTELGAVAKLSPDFKKRNVKVIGLSVDPVEKHAGWAKDIAETQGFAPDFPMIGDTDLSISKLYDMLPAPRAPRPRAAPPPTTRRCAPSTSSAPTRRSSCRSPNPMTTGRNFDEILRVVDSLQLTAKFKVATPADWKQGGDVIIAGSVSDEDAKKTYPTAGSPRSHTSASCRSRGADATRRQPRGRRPLCRRAE